MIDSSDLYRTPSSQRLSARSRNHIRHRKPKWRNWQTRWIQNPVWVIPCVGSSPTFGIHSLHESEFKNEFRFLHLEDVRFRFEVQLHGLKQHDSVLALLISNCFSECSTLLLLVDTLSIPAC